MKIERLCFNHRRSFSEIEKSAKKKRKKERKGTFAELSPRLKAEAVVWDLWESARHFC